MLHTYLRIKSAFGFADTNASGDHCNIILSRVKTQDKLSKMEIAKPKTIEEMLFTRRQVEANNVEANKVEELASKELLKKEMLISRRKRRIFCDLEDNIVQARELFGETDKKKGNKNCCLMTVVGSFCIYSLCTFFLQNFSLIR